MSMDLGLVAATFAHDKAFGTIPDEKQPWQNDGCNKIYATKHWLDIKNRNGSSKPLYMRVS